MILVGSVQRTLLESTLEKREEEWEKKLNEKDEDIPSNINDREDFFDVGSQLEFRVPDYDPCPFQVVGSTSLSRLNFMFSMLGLFVLFLS